MRLTEQELERCIHLAAEYHSAEVIFKAITRVSERGHVEQELKLFILGHALSIAEKREVGKKTKKTSRIRNIYGTSEREEVLSLADVHIKGCRCEGCVDFFRDLDEEAPIAIVRKEVAIICGKSVVPNSRTYEELAAKYGTRRHLISDNYATVASPGTTLHGFVNWNNTRVLIPMKWGFNSADNSSYNARAETLAEKPQWNGPFIANRCVIPLEGFYEQGKQFVQDGPDPLLVLGLYGIMPTSQEIVTAIITCAANDTVKPFHERMPVCIPNQPHVVWRWAENNALNAQLLARAIEYSFNELKLKVV